MPAESLPAKEGGLVLPAGREGDVLMPHGVLFIHLLVRTPEQAFYFFADAAQLVIDNGELLAHLERRNADLLADGAVFVLIGTEWWEGYVWEWLSGSSLNMLRVSMKLDW